MKYLVFITLSLLSISTWANDLCRVEILALSWDNHHNRSILHAKDIDVLEVYERQAPDYSIVISDSLKETESCNFLCSYVERRVIRADIHDSEGIVVHSRAVSYSKSFGEKGALDVDQYQRALETSIRKLPKCSKLRKY